LMNVRLEVKYGSNPLQTVRSDLPVGLPCCGLQRYEDNH
jgi:hypothetical protein